MIDPVPLAQALLRCRSVTPDDDGAQDVLAAVLEAHGFYVERLRFGDTPNLFASRGSGGPHICFAGHTDVVPEGEAWTVPPFAGVVRDGLLFGRGACDMKGAIAAFATAVSDPTPGIVSLLITGDEEGPATDGTVRVLEWMEAHGHVPDFCLVGEPTNTDRLGDVIKIGRRGSLNATLTMDGTQGHVAYPQRADNPVHRLVRTISGLIATPLDEGSEWFEPSSLQIVSIDVGNPATNIIPRQATARLNIRFNDLHSSGSLRQWLDFSIAPHASRYTIDVRVSGESFLTSPGPWTEKLGRAVRAQTGITPKLDTGGGTSDARFIARLCPVAEFGLVGRTMHQVDECVPTQDINDLTKIYRSLLTS